MITAYKFLEDKIDVGTEIAATEDHRKNLDRDKRNTEDLIRKSSKRGELRARAVFVFENRAVADDLLDQTHGKYLYEVQVDREDVLHRGDLRIYDEIHTALKNNDPTDTLLKDFWDGVQRPDARIELAVSKVRIGPLLVDADH